MKAMNLNTKVPIKRTKLVAGSSRGEIKSAELAKPAGGSFLDSCQSLAKGAVG